jgi:hypothetical protein
MKKIIILFLLIIPILITAKPVFDYHIDKPTHIYVGTPFHLKITFTTGLEDSIYSPKIDTLDIFILRKIKQNDTIQDSFKITNLDLDFAPFDVGSFNFPPLEFTVKTKNDSLYTFKTPEYKIIVESVIKDTTKTITDIHGPIKLKLKWWEIAIPLLALIIFILLIIYLIGKLKKEDLPEKKNKKIIPVYITAYDMLKKLKAKQLLEKGLYLDYFFELSYILRYFLEGYYKFNAVEMTTYEIKNALGNIAQKSQILALLNYADKVKFAKFIPTIEDGKKFEKWLEDYITEIKIKEEAKKAEENKGVK